MGTDEQTALIITGLGVLYLRRIWNVGYTKFVDILHAFLPNQSNDGIVPQVWKLLLPRDWWYVRNGGGERPRIFHQHSTQGGYGRLQLLLHLQTHHTRCRRFLSTDLHSFTGAKFIVYCPLIGSGIHGFIIVGTLKMLEARVFLKSTWWTLPSAQSHLITCISMFNHFWKNYDSTHWRYQNRFRSFFGF